MRRWKMLLALMLGLVVIAGCGNNGTVEETDEVEENEKATGEVIEIEWLAHPAYSLQSPGPERVEYLQNQIDAFEAEHGNVKIKPDVLSSNISEAMARLMEQAAQGRAPAIAQIDSYILPRFYDYLQPLDPLFEQAGLDIEDFFPFAQDIMRGPDGQIYGIQFTTDTRVLYYRTDVVDSPPATWDELFALSEQLKADGYEAFLFPGGRGEGTIVTSVLPFFWAQGGSLVDDQDQPAFGTGENREYMLNVLTFLHDMVQKGYSPQRLANYGSEGDLNSEVASGNVAMFIGGNWQVNQLAEILSEDDMAKWAVAPLPQREAGQQATTAGGWAWGIFTDDPVKQELAFDFLMRTFVGDEGMASWCTLGGYLPTRHSVYEHEAYEGNEFTDIFREHLAEFARMRPAATVYPEISTQLQIAVSDIVSGNKSPEEALEEAWNAVAK
ncbi:multiple sugar transport system substrate-binding protein [Caldalkalibacillus uzonensis]|uniref:Multiple sugar transport system substrate-binding protein n=1 Tax=Caldalkalibacillus uzonensis TaxID=353224 RepID=A0ABU0CQI9_9BACI|nr:extracellular solute-binding protein [Caldalkalibacillus uzonensis]MDQ0338678.1 multiple sugar transport system substrate-binding protein [Caldalkalibacillus uzonensis]